MKNLMLCLLLCLSGCTTINVVLPDGSQLKYTRFGNQQIGAISYDGSDKSFLIEKQMSDNAAAFETINKTLDIVKGVTIP